MYNSLFLLCGIPVSVTLFKMAPVKYTKCILYITLVWLCFAALPAIAQKNIITGTVTDAATGKPLPGANIFISNTAKGTVSAADGYFTLTDLSGGKFELVISRTGYQTIVYPFSSEKLPLKLNVQMEVKVKEWETVQVTPFEKDGWAKWGRLFTDAFLGRTSNADNCNILNKDAIRFRYNKKTRILEAVADTLLVIENKALGYLIYYQLEAFEYQSASGAVIYGGFPLFGELKSRKKRMQKQYAAARRKAYYGSTMHFIRALYRDSLVEEGYEVRSLQQIPNTEKQRVKALMRIRQADTRIVVIAPGNNNGDSSDYYRRITQQPDFFELIGQQVLTADSLTRPGLLNDYRIFTFPHRLYVAYKNEPVAGEFLAQHFGYRERRQVTRMFFVSETATPELHIYPNGSYFDPLQLFLDGYMGWEKMAELLPLEYEPNQ